MQQNHLEEITAHKKIIQNFYNILTLIIGLFMIQYLIRLESFVDAILFLICMVICIFFILFLMFCLYFIMTYLHKAIVKVIDLLLSMVSNLSNVTLPYSVSTRIENLKTLIKKVFL